jgi:hypothetical protein
MKNNPLFLYHQILTRVEFQRPASIISKDLDDRFPPPSKSMP